MKPGDLYVGVMDLFAVLLPGALLMAFVEATFGLSQQLDPALAARVGTEGNGWPSCSPRTRPGTSCS